jgi:hypothetical protein
LLHTIWPSASGFGPAQDSFEVLFVPSFAWLNVIWNSSFVKDYVAKKQHKPAFCCHFTSLTIGLQEKLFLTLACIKAGKSAKNADFFGMIFAYFVDMFYVLF